MAASTTTETETGSGLVCPECGKTFARVQGLAAHRRTVHGVAGTSATATRRRASTTARKRAGPAPARTPTGNRSRAAATASSSPPAPATPKRRTRRRGGRGNTSAPRTRAVDRDGLLRMLYPNGIPAREEAIRAVSGWLDEAERLARMR